MIKQKQLDELKVGGGATGVSDSGPGPTGGTASLPASKKQGHSMEKLQDPNDPGQEETDMESNAKPTGDMSAKNKASVAMKASAASSSMKEEVAQMFAGQDISEELVQAATSLFESTVQKRVEAIASDLEEQYNAALEEAQEQAILTVAESVDKYMDMVVEKFLEENQLAIESGLRAEIVEGFLGGLKSLFTEHYVEIPEDKVDLVDGLASRVDELEEQLNSSMNETAELRAQLSENARRSSIANVAEGLTVTQREKFETLAEGVEFDGDVEGYKSRLEVVKSSYFPVEKKGAATLTESAEPSTTTPVKKSVSSVSRYVNALDRTLKK